MQGALLLSYAGCHYNYEHLCRVRYYYHMQVISLLLYALMQGTLLLSFAGYNIIIICRVCDEFSIYLYSLIYICINFQACFLLKSSKD